ncbi:MAG: hypothetical protein CL739_02885 [Chloroflexi bacterium]|nr:hypothetical protein [Chloroflexota bacterium]MEC7836835.1 hypothetical protein [Chloroflexota bacterium]MEC9366936.1 hypothetical protein [Chloroflexota bacterium]MED5449804.1 hypothetical protein [Chloroflexota bacterium]MED6296279.1 hypothetical protein [Chloroflexota bacterium]|tara:strand:+ start:1803 stop:2075 length:273 start_codon:yes stop_codon:yes gene_type:complete
METNIYNIVGLIRDIAFIVCLPLICIFLILTIGKINRLLSSLARNSENMENITDTITGTFSEGSGFFSTAIKLFSLIGGIPRKKHGKGDN